jgi:gliding motility-associated-like protein
MKKNLLFSLIYLLSFSLYAQQGFENTTGPDALPSTLWALNSGTTLNGNWAVFDNGVGTAVRWENCVTGAAFQGTNAAYCNKENIGGGNTSEDFLATPAITIPANGQLKFWTKHYLNVPTNTIYEVRIKLQSASVQDNPNDYVLIAGGGWTDATLNTTVNVYEEKTVNIPATYIGVPVYIAFVMKYTQPANVASSDRWFIDEVSIFQQCIAPSTLTASPTQTTANLSWNPNGMTNFEIENGLNGFTPTGIATGTSLTGSYVQTGLLASTTYCYYVRSNCGGGNFSTWTGPFCYLTAAAAPACGGRFYDTGGINNGYQSNENVTTTICPSVIGEQVTVTFTAFDTESGFDILRIFDGSPAGTLLGTFSGTTLPPSFTSSAANGCLSFVFSSDSSLNGNGWVVDITCGPAPTCVRPINLAVGVTATTALLSWTQNPNIGGTTATAWQVIALPCGSAAPTATATGWIAAPTNPFTVTGLSASTCYDFYIRAVCSITDSSPWSVVGSANTLNVPPVCGGYFIDSGGLNNSYQNNEIITTTICPNIAGQEVSVTFTSFETENGFDFLNIYDGNDATGTLLGVFSGNTLPPTFTGSTINGCLTFVFTSDESLTGAGWKANVICNPAPACRRPVSLTSGAITYNSVSVGWTNLSAATAWQIMKLPCGSPPPTAATVGWVSAPTNPFVLTGLNSNTCYDIYVRTDCATDGVSLWSVAKTITTLIAPPICGGNYFDPGLNSNYSNNLNSTTLLSPISGTDKVTVTFTAFDTEQSNDVLRVYNGNSAAAPLIGTYSGTTIPPPITSSAANGCLYFVFISNGSITGTGWSSNITCGPALACPSPLNITASAVVRDTSTLSWIEPGTATSWQVLRLPCGSPAPTASTLGWVSTTSNPYIISGLSPNCCSEYYVRSVCSGNGAWSKAYQINESGSYVVWNLTAGSLTGTFPGGTVTAALTGTGNNVAFTSPSTQLNNLGTTGTNTFSTSGPTNNPPSKKLTFTFSTPVIVSRYTMADIDLGGTWNDTFNFNGIEFSSSSSTNVMTTNTGAVAFMDTVGNGEFANWYKSTAAVSSFSLDYIGNVTTLPATLTHAFLAYAMKVFIPCPVTVTAPTVTVNSPTVCNGQLATVTATPSPAGNYSYNWTVPAGVTIPANTVSSFTTAVAGTYSVIITDIGTGLSSTSGTGVVTLTPNIIPTFTQVAPICVGGTLAALPTTSINGITGTWSPALNNTATTTYTFTPNTTAGVCAVSTTMTIVVNQLIIPTFINPPTICSGAAAPVLPTTSTNVPPITGSWSGPVSNTATGTYTFTPMAGQCAATTTITVNVANTCSFDSYASAVWLDRCISSEFYNTVGYGASLIGPVANVFPNVNLGTYIQNSNTFILRGAELKTFKTPSSNVCGANFYYRVYPTATGPGAVTFSTINLPFLSDCGGGSFVVGGGPCTNGDQKWQRVLNNTQSPINLTAYPAGNYTIETYYDVIGSSTSTSGCLETKIINNGGTNFKANFSIQAIPTYSSTNPTSCNGSDGTITISDLVPFTTYAITYTDDGTTVGPTNILSSATGQIVITGLNAGNYTNITTLINGCTTIGSPITLTNPNIIPTFIQVAPICSGGTLLPLPLNSTNVIPISGTWSPALDNTRTTTYTFTPAANQCTTLPNTTMTIVVNQLTVPLFTPVAPICTGAVLPALPTTSNNGITGTWSPALNNTATTTYTFTPTSGLCATTQTMTITVNPNNSILLTSAAATTAQNVCINTPITNITYATTGATGATVSPLPAGVTSTWSAATGILISGTPTVAGTFNYTVTLNGGCGTITAIGQLIVRPNNNIVLTSAVSTTNQTRCINVSITNIRYTTTSATGVTITGLPTGITGIWSANVLNISGSSSIPGIYPYTVTTTGGCGVQVSLTGIITISPNNTITLNSAANTNAQTVCFGSPIVTINYTTTGATGATITGLPTGVTGSWSASTGYTITGTPTVTAGSPYTYTISLTGGCNVPIVTATGTITVKPLIQTTFAISSSSTCYGGSVPVLPTASTNATPILGTWSPSVISNTASGTYLFTPSAAGQCATTYTFNFVVNPLPAAPTVSIISQPTCLSGGRVDITSPLNTTGTASDLFISEVTDEEIGSLTYVEIYNGTGVTKNLANYKLKIYNNGIATPSCDLNLTGTILNNTVNIIKISNDPNVGGVIPNQIFPLCGGVNENDNIKLTSSFDVVIDNWGRSDGIPYTPNNQPGYTYRRLATATVPNTGWNPADWTAINPQVYINVGSYNYLTNLYNYNVDGGTYQSSVVFSPLGSGSHTFTVKNIATGCISSGTTINLNGVPGSITPVFAAYTTATVCQNPSLQVLLNTTSDNGVTGTWSPSTLDYSILGATSYTFTPIVGQCAQTVSFTITVTPNNTINLTSAVNTDNQTVCTGTALVNITYATVGATGATISGLPAGVTGNWVGNVVTISGSPTASASYTITLSGGCGTVVKTGTITVITTNTINLTSALNTDNQTVCTGTALVNITYATVGATGATISGLPAGVTGNWVGNVVTITGSPTASGSYTITLNGGCGTVVKTGTITVITTNTITLTSAVNTDNQTVCTGTALVNITYATAGATGATISGLPAGVSGNWVGNVVTISGSPTASASYTITLSGGCGTVVKTGTITVTPNNTITLLTANTIQTVCSGTGITNINYNSTGATNATFALPAGLTGVFVATTGSISISGIPTASGNYTVTLVGGCGNITASGTITVTTKITPTFNPISTICYGGSVPTLPAISNNMISGTWSPAVISNTVSGTYTFTPTTGCADNNGKIMVTVAPEFDFSIKGGCSGNNYVLDPVSTSTFSFYTWRDASNMIISNDASFNVTGYFNTNNITAAFPIVYSLTVANAAGCTKTNTFSINKIECGIQNGISPNGDNRFFDLRNRNVAKLQIFNRYGLLEYARDNYTEEWFGQNYAGIDLPDGTYYYYIEFKDNQAPVTGWIYINREHK